MDKVLALLRKVVETHLRQKFKSADDVFPTVDTRQGFFNILNRNRGIAARACKVDTTNGSIQ